MTRTSPPSVAGLVLSPPERARALAAALLDGPDLTGAACTGHAPLFDEIIEGESAPARHRRTQAAQALCRTCPALDQCAATAEGMDATQRAGVWAGVWWEHQETRRARVVRENAARPAEPP